MKKSKNCFKKKNAKNNWKKIIKNEVYGENMVHSRALVLEKRRLKGILLTINQMDIQHLLQDNEKPKDNSFLKKILSFFINYIS